MVSKSVYLGMDTLTYNHIGATHTLTRLVSAEPHTSFPYIDPYLAARTSCFPPTLFDDVTVHLES